MRRRVLRAGKCVRSRTLLLITPGSHELPFIDGEAAVGAFAGEDQLGAGEQLACHPRLVEPSGFDMGGIVPDFDADEGEATFTERARLGAEHVDANSSGFGDLKLAELTDVEVAMAMRKVHQ
jgi:hypothetical protein